MHTVAIRAIILLTFFSKKKAIIGFYRNQWIITMSEVPPLAKYILGSGQCQKRSYIGLAILETINKTSSEFLISLVFGNVCERSL